MKEYPSTSREFKVNGKVHKMRKLTLGLQVDIEDDNVPVTLRQVVECCTDMGKEEIDALHIDQFEDIYADVTAFTYDQEESGDGEPKKPSS